jgi:hypothetical protein
MKLQRILVGRRCFSVIRLFMMLILIVLAGCAPDSIRRDKNFTEYLSKLQVACPNLQIGTKNINEWLRNSGATDDDNYAYWLDMTSRLYYGKISAREYRTSVGGFLGQGTDNAQPLDCIIRNLPKIP